MVNYEISIEHHKKGIMNKVKIENDSFVRLMPKAFSGFIATDCLNFMCFVLIPRINF